MFFDDVKDLVEVMIDISKDGSLVQAIERLIRLLQSVMGLELPITVYL